MDKRNRKKRSMLIAMAVIFVLMTGLIFVTAGLTGWKDTNDFNRYDKTVFICFIAAEIVLFTVLMILAVKIGCINREKYKKQSAEAQKNETPFRKKLRMSSMVIWFISFAVVYVIFLAGIFYGRIADESVKKILITAAGIAGGALVLFVIVSFFINSFFVKKLNQMKIAEGQKMILAQRENAEITMQTKLKTLRRIVAVSNAYAIFLFLLGILVAFAGGFMRNVNFFYIPLFLSFIPVQAAILQLPASLTDSAMNSPQLLPEEEYPVIYRAAFEAGNHLGIRQDIKIYWTNQEDISAAVVETKNGIRLLVDVFLLNILTEKELYAAFLHELTHITDKQKNIRMKSGYCFRLLYLENGMFLPAPKALFALFDMRYQLNHFLYTYASSIIVEEDADSSMKDAGKDAVSALAKLKYKDLLDWEAVSISDGTFYEKEEYPENYLEEDIERFKKRLKERQNEWNELAKLEIVSRGASHPTIYSRIKKLGDYDLPESVEFPEGDYLKECQKVLQIASKDLSDALSGKYTEYRNDYYVKPMETVQLFEEGGSMVDAGTYRDVITAYDSVRNISKAMEVADRAIDELPEGASHFAFFYRGIKKLHMYDKTGLDDLYTAIERNHNYIKTALDIIGEYCCLTGLQEELDTYREKALEIMQDYSDGASKANYLDKNDKIGPEQLPEGMLENIVDYIKSIDKDCIDHVYLVRKTVSDDYFSSVFVVDFREKTEDDVKNEIMHKIFTLLDTTDWEFSLFEFPEVPKALETRIRRECVYEGNS